MLDQGAVDRLRTAGYTDDQISQYAQAKNLQLPSQTQTLPTNSQQPWTSGNNLEDTLVDWAPTIGGIAGSFVAPGLGTAGGAALGEALKEKIKGQNLDVGKVATQAALAAGGEALGGAITGKIFPAADVAAESIGNIGTTNLAKIFGTPEELATQGGTKGLVDYATEKGLTKLSSLPAITDAATTNLSQEGKILSDVLSQADQAGATVSRQDLLSAIQDAASKAAPEGPVRDRLIANATNKLDYIAQGADEVPVSSANAIKQTFQDMTRYNAQTTQTTNEFFKDIAARTREITNNAANDVGVNLEEPNINYDKARQIADNLDANLNRSTRIGGRGGTGFTPSGLIRTPAAALAIGKTGQTIPGQITSKVVQNLPEIAGQTVLQRKFAGDNNPPISGAESSNDPFATYPKETYPAENYLYDIQRDPTHKAYYDAVYQKYQDEYTKAVDVWKLQHPKQASTNVGLTTMLNRAAGNLVSQALPAIGQ